MKEDPAVIFANLQKDMPQIIQHISLMAELHRIKFNACLKAGFDEKQALELCKVVP